MSSKYFLLLPIFFMLLCKSSQQLNENQKSATISLKSIYEKPNDFINQEHTLRGQFLGWSGRECRLPENASPAITRSDWLFRDATGCIYVTGGRLSALDPFDTSNVGVDISIRVIPRLTDEKKVYLEFVEGSIIKGVEQKIK